MQLSGKYENYQFRLKWRMYWNYYYNVSIWSCDTIPAFNLQEFYFDLLKITFFRRLFWGLNLMERYHTSLLLIHIIISKWIYFYVVCTCMFFANIFSKSLIIRCFTLSLHHSQRHNFWNNFWFMSTYLKLYMIWIRPDFPPVMCGYEVGVSWNNIIQ